MAVTAYPVAHKRKSWNICLAFVRGCGGQIGTTLREGAAVFYGVDDSNLEIWNEVRASGRDFYYLDNSVFDSARQRFFRVTKNALQHTGIGKSDGSRFRALGIEVQPWRQSGEHIVVCPQSVGFMRKIVRYPDDWCADAVKHLRAATSRQIRVRPWSGDKGKIAASLQDDLRGAHALMTWSSAAAVTAVVAGVPVIVQARDAAASAMSAGGFELEALATPARENWLDVLADQEFSLKELQEGKAWQKLNP